jgi:hypothetical protein
MHLAERFLGFSPHINLASMIWGFTSCGKTPLEKGFVTELLAKLPLGHG